MDKETFEKYIRDRYENQISWYEQRSILNKRLYVAFQWAVIVLSALIPVLTISLLESQKYVIAGLGVLLAIGTAALKTFKFQENWLNYRTIAETLKKERHYYDAGLSGYEQTQDREALFVDRIESLISRENSLWVTAQRKEPESQSESTKQ